ncbi:hypothetical protein BGZ76_004412 [Entomortierella beljakovae]|nr:hypothetical protein BGZ76_004412 [Entomortierella beljakovae]
MLDLRSHRTTPYEYNPVSRRSRQPGSEPLQPTPSSPAMPNSPLATEQHRSNQTSPLRSPFRGRQRLPRTLNGYNHESQKYGFSSDSDKPMHSGGDDLEMISVETADVDLDVELDAAVDLAQELPAIFRLSPEVLALIFHYVYVTPIVHRPTILPQNEQQQNNNTEDMASRPTSSPSTSLSFSTPSSNTSFSSIVQSTPETTTANSTSTTTTVSAMTVSGARRKKDKRKSAVYIQNDISSMLALCLTCRAFYPQAIRMLWRQRTLTNYDDLTEFYQAIDFSASLRKRHQKQRQLEQQQQRPGMGYAVEEGLFNNEAALRVKSLTLLDMSLESTLPLDASVDTTTNLTVSQFFGNSSSHNDPTSAGANLDLCQGIDMFTKANSEDNATSTSISKDSVATTSSSSSASSSSSSSNDSLTLSKRRLRQKTTSIYSGMISPKLLQTIANHCYALVDLTICMDSKLMTSSTFSGNKAQPSIPFSIIAGTLLSLKRLTLMGLVCDPRQNKTGSELLIFAKNTQPLERISIRSCQGISLDTYTEFAVRSHSCLLSLDYQGLDFESSQQLTEMMSAYAYHCNNIKSITISCLNALSIDGTMEALAHHGATELQELHILGYDTFHNQQQQQQQQQGEPVVQAQQVQIAGGNNNINNNQNVAQVPITQMCHLTDANSALSNLSKLPLRRLTLYCPGITDFALFQYIRSTPTLVDLVLNEPTTILQHPQLQAFVQSFLSQPQGDSSTTIEQEENVFGPTTQPVTTFTSAGFFGLIFSHCPWLKYMFMKVSLETAQEWIVQPCFKEADLDKCLYQYRTATGNPAVILMWDTRNKTSIA